MKAIQVLDEEWPDKTLVREISVAGGPVRRLGPEPRGPLAPDERSRAMVKDGLTRTDSQIYRSQPDGSHRINISRSRSVGPTVLQEYAPVWSPDGSRIAFLFNRGRGTELRVMDADGLHERRVAQAPLTHALPDWSPDGRSLVFEADADDDGLDEVYVVAAKGGRPRQLAELEYVQDLKWQPAGPRKALPPTRQPIAAPRTPVRTFSYQLSKGTKRLANVRLLRRFGSDRERPTVTDLSPDGSLAALFDQHGLNLLELATNRLRTFARPRTPRAEPYALFSPDGRKLLYRAWDQLLVRDVDTRTSRTVGRSAEGDFNWLSDGRVAFADEEGTVQLTWPGGRMRPIPGLPRVDRFAITADGRRVVYERHCETFLLDRRGGRRRRLSGHLFVTKRAWAPDGSYFVLQWAEECNRKNGELWAYHSYDVLFSKNGTRLAEPGGRGATWSRDSALLFAYPLETGTQTAGTQGLDVIDPRRRRQSPLLQAGNAYSEAFVGPGRWVIFSAYQFPDRVSYGYTAGGLYVGRIVDS